MYQCDYQKFVECEKKQCDKCGWNPEVAQARLEAIIAKMMEKENEK